MHKSFMSICIITYNHEKYIRDSLESVLMQKINFPIEIVIGEDSSTDNTRKICEEYKNKFPEIIILRSAAKNMGVMSNLTSTLKVCRGKYIAICEGDDYWTDPYKLQKQVNFLEKNSDYSMCFHNSIIKNEHIKANDSFFCDDGLQETIHTTDLIRKFSIPTASMVFRRSALEIPTWLKLIYNGDYAISLLLSLKGKIKYLNDVMSVYRKNAGGLNARTKNSFVWYQKIELLTYFDYYTNFNFHDTIKVKKKELINSMPSILENEKPKLEKLLTYAYYKRKVKNINKLFNA